MKKILLLLANGFEIYEAAVFIDVFGWNYVDGDKSTQLFTCGIKREIMSSFNQKFQADFFIDEINVDDFEALAVPGGFSEYDFYDDAYHDKFLELIRKFNEKKKYIASVCVGALPLGKSGILKNRESTTYNMNNGIRQKQLAEFGAIVLNEPIVISENIITSWNPSTAIHVALKLLELLTTKNNSDFIKKIMGF